MERGTINDRFTEVADRVTTAVGQWWFTVLSLALLVAWVAYGVVVIRQVTADWFTSQQWNFPLNTITTVGEWFMEGLVLAAANRVERRNRALQQHSKALEERIDAVVEGMARLLEVDHREHGRLLHAMYGMNEEEVRIMRDLEKLNHRIGQVLLSGDEEWKSAM
jgi:uncharacterized membrane protein